MDRLLLLFQISIFLTTTAGYRPYGKSENERSLSDRLLADSTDTDRERLERKSVLLNEVLKKRDFSTNSYCDPPNPCPSGQHVDCIDKMFFENTPEFNRNFILEQDCSCDNEHMLNCQYQQLYRIRRPLFTATSF